MSTLTESIQGLMTPELIGSMAARTGVSSTKVRAGLTTATNGIMDGLATKARDPAAMANVVDLIDRTPEVEDPARLLDEDTPIRSSGTRLLNLASDDSPGMVKRLASTLGIGSGASSSLLGIASGLIMSALRRFSRARGGLNASSLGSALLEESHTWRAATPTHEPDRVYRAEHERLPRERHVAHAHGRERKWLWLLALLPILLIGIWLFNRRDRAERPDTTVPTSKVTEPDTTMPRTDEPSAVTPRDPNAPEPRTAVPPPTAEEPTTPPADQPMPQAAPDTEQGTTPTPGGVTPTPEGTAPEGTEPQPQTPDVEATEPEGQTPGVEATEPGVEATEPGADTSEPGVEATEPGADTSEPGFEATEPQPQTPDVEATEPGAEATEPEGQTPADTTEQGPSAEADQTMPGAESTEPQAESMTPQAEEPSAQSMEQAGAETEIHFPLGSSRVSEADKTELARIVEQVEANPDAKIEVSGYTDGTGSPELNQKLSEKRAENVKQMLIDKGVDSSRIEAQGFGAEQKVDDTDAANQSNRRVSVRVIEQTSNEG